MDQCYLIVATDDLDYIFINNLITTLKIQKNQRPIYVLSSPQNYVEISKNKSIEKIITVQPYQHGPFNIKDCSQYLVHCLRADTSGLKIKCDKIIALKASSLCSSNPKKLWNLLKNECFVLNSDQTILYINESLRLNKIHDLHPREASTLRLFQDETPNEEIDNYFITRKPSKYDQQYYNNFSKILNEHIQEEPKNKVLEEIFDEMNRILENELK